MLNIQPILNTAQAKAYYKNANRDYFAEGLDHPAYWQGKAAERLGLKGEVNMDDFFALCDNVHPHTGEQLTKKMLANRRVGYDFTFSAPKSVSVAWTLGGDNDIANAFREAVAETMTEMERAMETRVRKGGAEHNRNVGNMVWCDWLHPEGRPIAGRPDPQLHIHATAFNIVWDQEERQWKAGEFAAIKSNAPYYHAAYLSRLSSKLNDLGYQTRRTKDAFEIVGVPERVLKEFSRRTQQIEKLAADLGVVKPESKAKLGATSREAKVKGLSWQQLLDYWNSRLKPGEKEAILASKGKPVEHQPFAKEAVDLALEHVTTNKSVVPEREAVRWALLFGLGKGVTPDQAWGEMGRKGIIRRDGLVTTQKVLDEEKKILAFAVEGRGTCKPLAGVGELDRLSPSQQSAIRHVWQSPDRLMIIRGLAGSGKTTLTKTLLAGIDKPWVILAPTTQASRGVLRKDGFDEADTLARFNSDAEIQEKARGGLIVLDEASLAGARDVSTMIQIADSIGARVLLLGDRAQHKSVPRGDILSLLEDKAGLPVATVGEIQRQHGEYKQAVKMLAKGDPLGGFDKLDDMGWVKEASNEIVSDYLDARNRGKSVLIVAPTHAQGDTITAAIRAKLKEEGKISHEEKTFTQLVPLNLTEAERKDKASYAPGMVAQYIRSGGGVKAGRRVFINGSNISDVASTGGQVAVYGQSTLALAAGDTIRITANGKAGEHRVINGATYTVAGFTKDGDILLDNGWTLSKHFGHFKHGYVETSFASQGKTVDEVFISMPESTFPAVNAKAAYVAVSRGRLKATIYTDNKDELRDLWFRTGEYHHATDLVREPIGNVRRRLKRHIAFLKERAVEAFNKVIRPEVEISR